MSLLKNRTLAYEVSTLVEGRWTIDCILHDEAEATEHGRSLFQTEGVEEIKIVRQRTGPTGFTVETEILREAAPKEKSRPVALSGDPDQVPLCHDAQALYGIQARLAVGRLMRRYLEQQNITATELMHVWPYLRRLDDRASHLLAAAIFRVGEAQAKTLGVTARARASTLQRWVAEGMSRVREFDYLRRKLPFDIADFDRSMRRLDAAIGEDHRQFGLVGQLCYQLLGVNSLAGRLEALLEMAKQPGPPELVEALDGLIADILSFPSVIGETVATLPNRAEAIGRLADVVAGRFAPPPGDRSTAVLVDFMARRRAIGLNLSAEIILDWLVREMGRGKPLDRHDSKRDEALLQLLLPRLRDENGQLLGGARMQEAIGAHRLAQRQQVLRDMGMHDQANELAKAWSPDMVERFAPLVEAPLSFRPQ